MKFGFKRQLATYLVVLLLAVSFLSFQPGAEVRAALPEPELIGSSVVADIAEASMPKVVWVISTFERQVPVFPFGRWREKQQEQGFGSGFFFDENGHILTNAHVVAGAQAIEVTLQGQDKPIPAKLIGLDRDLDLAIVQVDLPEKAAYLTLGDSDQTRVGEWVIAIGNPLGLDHSVTQGIISAKGRPLIAGDRSETTTYENMIQTDAAINPGNSGGPLLNLKGEVIGINTAVSAAGQNLGFAIPINTVKEVLFELMTKGRLSHPWLGVEMMDARTLDAKTRAYIGIKSTEGVLVNPVKGSPADKAGLQPFDLVVEINRQPITTVEEMAKFIRKCKVGDKLNLLVMRKGIPVTVEAVLEEKPQPKE
jgi:serine protease Do